MPRATFLYVLPCLLGLTACGTPQDFTCKSSGACGEYRADSVAAAEGVFSGDICSAGLTCGNDYDYVCYFEGDAGDIETCTFTNTPGADDACLANFGDTQCPW